MNLELLIATTADWTSLVGLAVAIHQIWRTRRIVAVTQDAVQRATQRLSVYNLLLVVPELSRIESELDAAVRSNRPADARRLLTEWRERASELRGILRSEQIDDQEVEPLVQESLTLITPAKNQLGNNRNVSLFDSTKRVRKSIEGVCQETRTLAARIRSTTPLGISDDDSRSREVDRKKFGKLRLSSGKRNF